MTKRKGGYSFSSWHKKKIGADRKVKKLEKQGKKAMAKKVAGGYMVVATKR